MTWKEDFDALKGISSPSTPQPVLGEVNRAVMVINAYKSGYADGMRYALDLIDRSRHEMVERIALHKPGKKGVG